MTVEIPRERLERARQLIEADEASKPQPAMTDELRAEVARKMAEMQGRAAKSGEAESKAQTDAAEVADQAEAPAVRGEAAEVVRVSRGRPNPR